MARGEWGYYNGRTKWCSYRRTTLIICSINIGVALYVLHTLYNSLYTYPFNDPQKGLIFLAFCTDPFANLLVFDV